MPVVLKPVVRRVAASGPARLVLVDIAIAGGLCFGLLFADSRSFVTHVGATASAARIAGIVVAALAVAGRRPYPHQSLVLATLAGALVAALGGPPQASICIAVTAYAAAAGTEYARWWVPPTVASVVIATGVTVGQDVGWLAALAASVAFVWVGWFAGQAAKERRNRLQAAAEQQAEREQQHAADLRQAAIDERLVIARELHDIVAHSMSVIAVRAGVARMVMDDDPAEVKRTLGIIETTTRQALHEMRLLVEILRREHEVGTTLTPTPGLADIAALVEQIRQAGIDLSLAVQGTARPLPAGVDLSAYRIAQEALTNVVRHAGPTTATLRIEYRADEVLIEVTDAGPAEPKNRATSGYPVSTGHGLIGMSERVALFDGHLRSGPRSVGFEVQALLRTDEATA